MSCRRHVSLDIVGSSPQQSTVVNMISIPQNDDEEQQHRGPKRTKREGRTRFVYSRYAKRG